MKPNATANPDESPGAVLYERHAVPILAYLRLHVPTWEDAEDVLQEVFLAAIEHRGLLNLPENEQLAWLGGVVRHKLVDCYRRSHRRTALPLAALTGEIAEEATRTPESVVLLHEGQREVWEAVKHLSALQQQVVYLRFVGGLHCPQIANLLGKREDAIRKLLSRAMNQLRGFYAKP